MAKVTFDIKLKASERSAALLVPNPGETPVVPSVQEAPPIGFYVAAGLFCASSLVSVLAVILAMLAKYRLKYHLLQEGGPMVGRGADRQLDTLKRWRLDLILKHHQAAFLITTYLIFCGFFQLTWCIDRSLAYQFVPFAVLGVAIFLAMSFVRISP